MCHPASSGSSTCGNRSGNAPSARRGCQRPGPTSASKASSSTGAVAASAQSGCATDGIGAHAGGTAVTAQEDIEFLAAWRSWNGRSVIMEWCHRPAGSVVFVQVVTPVEEEVAMALTFTRSGTGAPLVLLHG